uniref:Uncharacterized protein n=1 Tax=Felis catus TaxID=9685 RepID=A0ABI7ZC19_FELCA
MGPAPRAESLGNNSLLRFLCWGGGRDASRRGPGAVLRMELCVLRLRQLRDLLVPVLAARLLRVPGSAPQHFGRGAQVHRGRHRRERQTHEPGHGPGPSLMGRGSGGARRDIQAGRQEKRGLRTCTECRV